MKSFLKLNRVWVISGIIFRRQQVGQLARMERECWQQESSSLQPWMSSMGHSICWQFDSIVKDSSIMNPAQLPYSSLAICFKEKNGLSSTKQWICLNLAATASATAQPIDLPQTIALSILNPFLSMQLIMTIASYSTFFELVFPQDTEQPLYSNANTENPVSKLIKQRSGAEELMSSPLAWKKTTIFCQYPTWKKHGTYRSESTLIIFSSIQLICGLQLSIFCLR